MSAANCHGHHSPSVSKPPLKYLSLVGAVVLLVLVTALGASAAVADEGGVAELGGDGWAEAPQDELALPVTNPEVADELPHGELQREEAIALDEGVFQPLLEAAAGIFEDLNVERFISNYAAVVPAEEAAESIVIGNESRPTDSPLALLESSLPLRLEGDPIDLTLERSDEALQPMTPLVDVKIPTELGEDISLPDVDIQIEASDAPDSVAPSISNGTTALYPNVATDSDLIVAPTPTGMETFTVLRSAVAPRSQTFELSLPLDAELTESRGGAVVRENGKTIMSVLPPTAYDAAGSRVPASLETSGASLTVTVAPEEGTEWPVIVDPIYEIYNWWAGPGGGSEWTGVTNNPSMGGGFGYDSSAGHWYWSLVAGAGSYAPGHEVSLRHSVPRLAQGEAEGQIPTSYILNMRVMNLSAATSPGTSSPYPLAEIWKTGFSGWAGKPPFQSVWGYPGNAEPLSSPELSMTTGDDHEAKIAFAAALGVNEPATSGFRAMTIGGVNLETTDPENPEVVNPSPGGIWMDKTAKEPVTAIVKDPGLGAKSAWFEFPGQAPVTVQNPCAGTSASPCPAAWPVSVATSQYNPAAMPQGEVRIPIFGYDALAKRSPTVKARVNVDHMSPLLSLGGSLTEQGSVGVKLPQYTLSLKASDGDNLAAVSVAPLGIAGSGAGQIKRPMGVDRDPSGNLLVLDRERNKVIKFDPSGNFISEFGVFGTGPGQLNDPRGFAVSPNGNIWIAEFGNKRVEGFTPNGGFIRALKWQPDSRTTWPIEPYAVATGPGGAVWVSDISADAVFKFKEDGTYVGKVKGHAREPNTFNTELLSPQGLATDRFGNIWVTDNQISRVLQFDGATLGFRTEFGANGTGDGQLKLPVGLAISDAGNVLVVDGENNRVQGFMPDGTYLRQFGTVGAGQAQLSEPRDIAVGPGNTAFIADAGNNRIARWSHADLDVQSGVRKVQVKIDGKVEYEKEPNCAVGSCALPDLVLNADFYPVGQHQVEVVATDGAQLSSPPSKLTIETHGDLVAPGIALSGPMTEQASLGTTRPKYRLNVSATDTGSAEERKSGVASTTIKVDGQVVDSVSPGCASGGCAISREWTLNSNSYSVGSHAVQITAIDAAGRSATKSLAINIARDTTPPQLTATGSLIEAPEGWVQQKSFSLPASVTDVNGYGVKDIQLKIDGQLVAQNVPVACDGGGCARSKTFSLNTAGYEGGAHAAEVLATDYAGNVAKKSWTMNVDPSGAVPAEEATQTLEAMEETVPDDREFTPVAATEDALEQQVIEAGDNPHFVEEGGEITSTGVTTTTAINPSTEEITIEGTMGPLGLNPLMEVAMPEISEQSATVLPGADHAADTVVRPEYNGAVMFTTIRDEAAPEEFGWHIKLGTGQYLDQIDPQHIAVRFGDGEESWLISADPAHDATGKGVLTGLKIAGGTDVILTVQHRGKQLVYPVAAGQSYETGYAVVTLVLANPPPPASEEAEDGVEGTETEDLGPLDADEQQDAFEWLNGVRPRRDKDKPVHLRQAKRLARNVSFGQAPPPTFTHLVGGPGGGSNEIEEVEPIVGRICSGFTNGCDIWDVDFDDNGSHSSTYGVNFKWNGSQWVRTYVADRGPVYCSHSISWWWSLNVFIEGVGCGVHNPHSVKPGSEQHLSYYYKYNVAIFVVPELPGEVADKRSTLVTQVFPNGYQRVVAKVRWKNLNEI